MIRNHILDKIERDEWLDLSDALLLWKEASLAEMMSLANEIRFKLHPDKKVSWLIDRNVNLTNVCFSQCLFCNFCTKKNDENAYVLDMQAYREKIDALFRMGGRQLLLQGGMNPDLDLPYYENLFKQLKNEFPELKLHALGPPEIHWLAKKENISIREVLLRLISAGLDSLPGAGAEILSDRVRQIVSPGKATTREWLNVMKEAHKLRMVTSATMMFGFIESIKERIEHLIAIREIQGMKPEGAPGFISFIPWPYQRSQTKLFEKFPDMPEVYGAEYIKMIAFSRIMLPNIPNIQASWLTVGHDTAAMALHAGANDLGSVMIEENVVSSAGANYQITPEEMQNLIRRSGFTPVLRDQNFMEIENPTD